MVMELRVVSIQRSGYWSEQWYCTVCVDLMMMEFLRNYLFWKAGSVQRWAVRYLGNGSCSQSLITAAAWRRAFKEDLPCLLLVSVCTHSVARTVQYQTNGTAAETGPDVSNFVVLWDGE